MTPKQLYRKFYSKYDLAKWFNEKNELVNDIETKYNHCGTSKDLKKEFIDLEIGNYFLDEEVYLIITSGNSSLVPKSVITERIEQFIDKKEIGIIDKSFSKIMFFNSYGTFKKGLVINYPKSRERVDGTSLKVSFHANIYEASTQRVAKIIQEPFEQLSERLSNDYNGNMEHLWVDLELIDYYLKERKPYSFRFQKRVTLSGFGLPGKDYNYNVGHYSVAPDFNKLKTLPENSICDYILRLIYESTQVLVDKKKKLNNFNGELFRADFIKVCIELGYLIEE